MWYENLGRRFLIWLCLAVWLSGCLVSGSIDGEWQIMKGQILLGLVFFFLVLLGGGSG